MPAVRDEADPDIQLVSSAHAGAAGLVCSNHYRGIGVAISYSGYVREVVAGGPADMAGLKVGDRFMNDAMFIRDQYPIGKSLTLRIERDGRPMELPVKVDRVCYEKVPT